MSTTDLPGSSLLANRYRLVERLGAGGMSVVWRGFDEVLGRQVAVKVLPPSTSADPSFRRRLRAEAQAAARLSHPHITNVYDYGEAITVDGEPVPYVVMELVDGESLAAVLARVRRLPWPAAVRICSEVSAALAAAHARGIVHRDVTPANVMLTPTGAKVVDFGISALIGENDIDPDGSLLGTPAYLAPERLEGGQVSPATDVYAVGLLIYRTLIGQLPWDVGTTTALLRAHQYTEPDPLPAVEGLPTAVSELVERCLEKHPDDRPSSAELAHVLAGAAAGNASARGYVPDWAENGEDTTILPSPFPYTNGIGRIRPGHAQVADSIPAQAGRGVAPVRAAAEGPAGLAAAAASLAAAEDSAPVSPAPGNAIPVSVSDVEAALAGKPVSPAAGSPAADDAGPASDGNPGPGRKSRLVSLLRPAALVGAAAAPAVSPSDAPAPAFAASGAAALSASASAVAPLRPAFSGPAEGPQPAPPQRGAGGGDDPPSDDNPPGGSGPGGSGPAGRGRPQSRRVLIVAGAFLLLGGATYAWSTAAQGDHPREFGGVVTPQPSVLAASGKCVVSYAVESEGNNRFDATVTVANRDNTAIKNWNLLFIMKGDQVISGKGDIKLDQQGNMVTINGTKMLSAQKALTMKVSGRYARSNAAPMVFKLGANSCETYVSGKPGEPSRPVQRLSNGEVRLGPPVRDNQVPGIAVRPDGVAVPVPVTSGGPIKTSSSPSPDANISSPVQSEAPLDCDATPFDTRCLGPSPGPAPSDVVTDEPTVGTSTPPTEEPSPGDPADIGADTGADDPLPLPPGGL